jgi:regulation of enolase protein 1 (concanavalin A-like superfamily)
MASGMEGMTWLNEPPWWELQDGILRARSGERTDFWRGTHYGFYRDDGHFLARRHDGEFTAEVTFDGRYETLYDQAGLMVRADAERWVKMGVEYTDGAMHFSVVVTNGRSDWSVQRLPEGTGPVSVRVTRLGDALFVQQRTGSAAWAMARLAFFPAELTALDVGPMFCSPQRAGFEANFRDFSLGAPVSRDIH